MQTESQPISLPRVEYYYESAKVSDENPLTWEDHISRNPRSSLGHRATSDVFTKPWQIITSITGRLEEDAMFWWETTGNILGTMMEKAGYDIYRQFQYLLFYYHHIVPLLGKKPTRDSKPNGWKSFMTDDHTPIELSWSWSEDGSTPTVRFSIEPISPDAGSPSNPMNHGAMDMTIGKMTSLLSSPDLDLGWYRILSAALTIQGTDEVPECVEHSRDHRSQNFVAFDLNETGVLLKAYFLPGIRAIETGRSRWAVVREALNQLSTTPNMGRAILHLTRFIDSRPEDRRLEVEIIGIDCIKPEKSRLKVYVRSRLTTFEDAQRILSIGGVLEDKGTKKSIQELRSLWAVLFGLDPNFPDSESLPSVESRTSGILYYFEINHKSEFPHPKVYLPVRHYGRCNDLQISVELERYLSKKHRYFVHDSYVNALRETLYVLSLQKRATEYG